MRAFAYLQNGQAGWVEKERPHASGFDAVLQPLLVSPCFAGKSFSVCLTYMYLLTPNKSLSSAVASICWLRFLCCYL